jgi:hypothetical protein
VVTDFRLVGSVRLNRDRLSVQLTDHGLKSQVESNYLNNNYINAECNNNF